MQQLPMGVGHAKYAPSGGHRWMKCPASIRHNDTAPKSSSPYARDGDEAHILFTWAVSNRVRDAHVALEQLRFPMIYRVDTEEERLASVQVALDYVFDLLDNFPDAIAYVETLVQFPSRVTKDAWGRSDVFIYVQSMQWLYVIDYKHGAGIDVEVVDNIQVGMYATSVLEFMHNPNIGDVTTVIIQPRSFNAEGPIRCDTKSADYYRTFFRDTIDHAIAECEKKDAPFKPGKEQCKFCPGKATCPALEAEALKVVNTTFASVKDVVETALPEVTGLSVDRLAFIKTAAPLLRGWLDAVDDIAFVHAVNGNEIPGYKIVAGVSRRKFIGEPLTIAHALMGLIGTDDWDKVFPRQLVGIMEAERMVKVALSARTKDKKKAAQDAKKALAQLTAKETSKKFSLAPLSDDRPAINLTQETFKTVQLFALPNKEGDT